MQRSKRQKLITAAVSSGPRSIQALAELTGVSAVSIRRDLMELADQGVIRRVRGGAAPMPHRGANYPFALRQTSDIDLKRALAQATAELIEPGESVFIDNGTTSLAVAEELSGKGLTGMAVSLHSAAALASKPGNQVIVPGGLIEHDGLAFTSAGVVDAVAAMQFDTAIIGTCGANPDVGLTVADWGDAQVKRAAFASAQRVILVSTADKFSQTAAHRFASIADLDVIVTTRNAPPGVTAEAHIAGVTVIEVDDAVVDKKEVDAPTGLARDGTEPSTVTPTSHSGQCRRRQTGSSQMSG